MSTPPLLIQRLRGAALVSALLVVALATALASSMIWRQDLWLHQVETRRDLAQARVLAIAAVDWARAVLAEDARTSQYDHPSEPWGTKVPQVPAEGGEIGGEMADELSKWNINNLLSGGKINSAELEVFQRLLKMLELPAELGGNVASWLGENKEADAGAGQDSYYLQLTPPYRSAKRELSDVDNLLRVRGFDAATVERLRPYVTALPGYNKVNINTASAIVIAAELPGISPSEAPKIIANRDRIPFRNMTDFRNRLSSPQAANPADTDRLDVRSRYFSASVNARYGQAEINCTALLDRQNPWPDILWLKFQ